jgi:glycosyltransferase involved in cell wall biosynthesis
MNNRPDFSTSFMPKTANITAAIPTLDRPEALSRCLEGLFQGEALPAEVIVVDQGQSESARQIIDRFRPDVTPIVHCRQPRKGLSAARNLASALASCPVIAFTDDDCVPDPGWIARIDRALHSFPEIDGVSGRILPLGPESPEQFAISIRTGDNGIEYRDRALPWDVGSGGNFAVKRDRLIQLGGYDERLGAGTRGKAAEDMDLFHRILRSGASIRYEPAVVIYHERQDRDRLLLSCLNYGHGIGAFSAKHLRKGDLYAGVILGSWLYWLFRKTGSFIVHRDSVQVKGSLLSLRGCLYGLAYGFKLG